MLGKKGNRQGIVFAPYIIQSTTPAIVEGNFTPTMSLKSRYSTATIGNRFYMDSWMRNWKRKSRIEKIYKIEKPTEE
jgi:hypothetical protein